jgi:hypothetical protein
MWGDSVTRSVTATASVNRPSLRTGAYWAVTAVVVGEAAIGGTMDLLRMAPFYPVLLDLGYPGYLSTILGAAKVAAAVVIASPGLRRLKEWAYAGVLINMVGAMASHLAVHDSLDNLVAPATFAVLALLSWALRPASRRL